MRTLTISVVFGALAWSALAAAQDDEKNVTLSESAGAAASAPPVVQVQSDGALRRAPAAAAAEWRPARARYGHYGGAATETDGEWGFRYNGYFRAPMNIGFGERIRRNGSIQDDVQQPAGAGSRVLQLAVHAQRAGPLDGDVLRLR